MSTATISSPVATPINLTPTDAGWIEFVVNDRSFGVDVMDALDDLAKIERQHRDLTKLECLDCGHEWEPDRSDETKLMCPACQSLKARSDPRIFDAIAAYLTDRYGVPRCSRRVASAFYSGVMAAHESLKKTNSPTLESDTGSTSTQAAGQTGGNGSG